MQKRINPFFTLYQWLIAFPVLFVLTILTALATIVLSPAFPDKKFSYFPARWWGRAFCYLLFIKVKVSGLENLDDKQSYVIVSNHQSMYDIFVLYGWMPMIFKWMMKAELRGIPLVGKACESAGHVFINRSSAMAAKHSIERAEQKLRNGVSLVVFPEGTRSYTGKPGKFKRGAYLIATDLKLPIVPVTLRGCFECLPRNTFNVRPGLIEIIVHQPVSVTDYTPDKTNELIQYTYDIVNSCL